MAVQAPAFFDNLGQDWMPMPANSGFGLPHPFPNPAQPLQVDGLLNSISAGNLQPLRFSNNVADEFDRQNREIDMFLQIQNERLKYAIQQQNKKQIATLLNSIEPKALARVRKAEQDLAKVTRRSRELEECLKRAEMENEAWKRRATENESMVLGLNNMLGQARERLSWASGNGDPAQDAESVCECDWAGEEDRKTTLQLEDDIQMGCKGCKTQRSCVVFLPCKHLCACRQCGSLFGVCPVCKSVKEGTIEVLFD